MGRNILPVLVLAGLEAAGCASAPGAKHISVYTDPPGASVLFLNRGKWDELGESPIVDFPYNSTGKWRGYLIVERPGYLGQVVGIDAGKIPEYFEMRFTLEPDLKGPLTIDTVPDGAMVEVERDRRNWDPEKQWLARTGQKDWVLVGNGHIELTEDYFKGNYTGTARIRVSFPGLEPEVRELELGKKYTIELGREDE